MGTEALKMRATVTELVEPRLVLWPSLVSGVNPLGLASTKQAKMGKSHSYVVVLQIGPKFWWMLPMGVRNNSTKYELETQQWFPGTVVASVGPPFQDLQFRPQSSLCLPKRSRSRWTRPNEG